MTVGAGPVAGLQQVPQSEIGRQESFFWRDHRQPVHPSARASFSGQPTAFRSCAPRIDRLLWTLNASAPLPNALAKLDVTAHGPPK